MGKQKESKSTCGKCGVPCECSSRGPKNANCGCGAPPDPQPTKETDPCECGCSPPPPPEPKLPSGACTCGCNSPQHQPRPISEDCECDESRLQPQPQPKRQNGACACRYSPLQTEPTEQSEDCACDFSTPQPQPQPKRQNGACACRYSPLQTEPTEQSEDCACDFNPPQPQLKPKRESRALAYNSSPPPPQPKRQSGACACRYSPLETEPTWESEDCTCDSSRLRPQRQNEAYASVTCPRQPQSKSKRQSGTCACGYSHLETEPACENEDGACDVSPLEPQEAIRIPCSPEIKLGAQAKVYCQCNQSGQSQSKPQSEASAGGSSAPNKSRQHSDAQPLDYCQCSHQPGKSEKKDRVQDLETYVCFQPRPQAEVQRTCDCTLPYPKPKASYGLAAIKSSPEPNNLQRQEPKKSQQIPKKNQQPRPNQVKAKKKNCTIQ